MATEYSGKVLSVAGERAWKGGELTNGFLMKNADGRVAAITQSGTIDMTANSAVTVAVPYGNGLTRALNPLTPLLSNNLQSGTPTGNLVQFAGVVKYEPGWAASHPVQNWGIPAYSKFTAITRGIVGYKYSQKTGQTDADYLGFVMGDWGKRTAIDTYEDWIQQLAATATQGANLYLLVSRVTGFPKVQVGGPVRSSVVVPAGYMLVGQAAVFEPENGMIGFELDGHVIYGS